MSLVPTRSSSGRPMQKLRSRPFMILLNLSLSALLVVGTTGCSRTKPREHWWQFWRPKATDTSAVYQADTLSVPPPGSVGDGGNSSGIGNNDSLPPPPVGDVNAPDKDGIRAPGSTSSELQPVFFDYDSADLSGDAMGILDGDAHWLLTNPNFTVQLEGHTDERGTTEYNYNLGLRRAKSVQAYLVTKGVKQERLQVISYGEDRPLDISGGDAGMARNRRVQFLVY